MNVTFSGSKRPADLHFCGAKRFEKRIFYQSRTVLTALRLAGQIASTYRSRRTILMFLFLVCGQLSAADEVTQVRRIMSTKRYQQWFDTATGFIRASGAIDANAELFLLTGQCGYEIKKFYDASTDLSRFIAAHR
jgi:hypothetical protein